MSEAKDRSWHKTATIVISTVTLILSFISVIYYKQMDLRNQRIHQIDDKIKAFQDRLEVLNRIPKVAVEIKTLKSSGLPESAFQGISPLPSVVEITHKGGATARGITIQVQSNSPILQVLPDKSIDSLSVSVAKDGKAVTFDIPQLRRDELLRATIMHRGLATLDLATRIDEGEIIKTTPQSPEGSGDDTRIRTREGQFLQTMKAYEPERKSFSRFVALISFEAAQELSPDDFTSVNDVLAVIEGLKLVRREVAEEPTISIIPQSQFSVFMIAGLLSLALMFVVDVVNFYVKKRILKAREANNLKIGQKNSEVVAMIGTLNRTRSAIKNSTECDELWYYHGYDKLFIRKSVPGVAIFLSNGIVSKVEYLE